MISISRAPCGRPRRSLHSPSPRTPIRSPPRCRCRLSPMLRDPAPAPEPEPEPVVDPVMALLADTYTWDERGPRVALLQEALGVAADGWYAHATQQAHRAALDFVGLPTDIAPAPVLPPGPDASEWAALRELRVERQLRDHQPVGQVPRRLSVRPTDVELGRRTPRAAPRRRRPGSGITGRSGRHGPRPVQRARCAPLAAVRPSPVLTPQRSSTTFA